MAPILSYANNSPMFTIFTPWPRTAFGRVRPFLSGTANSSLNAAVSAAAIPQLLQVGGDGSIELVGFPLLLSQHRSEPLHLLLKWLAVVLDLLGSDVSARREHVAVLADVVELGGLAEAGPIC